MAQYIRNLHRHLIAVIAFLRWLSRRASRHRWDSVLSVSHRFTSPNAPKRLGPLEALSPELISDKFKLYVSISRQD